VGIFKFSKINEFKKNLKFIKSGFSIYDCYYYYYHYYNNNNDRLTAFDPGQPG